MADLTNGEGGRKRLKKEFEKKLIDFINKKNKPVHLKQHNNRPNGVRTRPRTD